LRLTLARRWLQASNERTEQEFHGPAGAVHRLLIASGIRSAPLDVREQAVLEQARTELDQPRAQTDTWGTWLALHLYADPQTFTRSNRALLPIWLRDVVGSH
jgi:hypothetical protein